MNIFNVIFFVSLLLALPVSAQCLNENESKSESGKENHTAELFTDNNKDCIAIGQWHVSVALGGGVLTNPLNGRDNIPLVIIPSISYYGEHFFLENNSLGYTFKENANIAISAITQLNREKAFFSKSSFDNVLVDNSFNSIDDLIGPEEDSRLEQVNANDVEKRQWAIDGGVQINWFIDANSEIKIKLLHDINQVYNGFNGQVAYKKLFRFQAINKATFNLTLGANWQSKQLVDYYYGTRPQQGLSKTQEYQGSSAVNPFIKLATHYYINQHWAFKAQLQREFLASAITASPLVGDKTIDTAFVGVVYAF